MKTPMRWMSLACVLLFICACQTERKYPAEWISAAASAPSERVLWSVALDALQEQRFPVGAGADPATMVALTGWRYSLAPFKGQGFRQRVRLRLESSEPGKYTIFLQVEKDTNEDLARPMDLRYAQWEEAADDVDAANILLSKIQARVGNSLEVGEPRRGIRERVKN